ncbi:MAG: hypothetical protein KDA24_23650 [Deltaproteobacteria bacterium]|nr:hypothetical protein [Deltaproteobacteria bacterium]
MSHRSLSLITLLCLSLAVGGCTRARGGGAGEDDGPSGPLVKGLAIDGLAFYQGVRIDLLDGDEEVIDDAPVDVIAGRDGMLRVFVSAGSSWETRMVGAVVTLDIDGETETVSGERNISDSTNDESLSNSINVDIPGDLMTRDTQLVSVKLIELEDIDAEGNSSGAEWTADGGMLDLNARDTGPSLRIILVPIVYEGDGSGREPDMSEAQIQIYRDRLYAQYPTREIDLVVADEMVANWQISPFGQWWSQTLEQLYFRRESDGAAFEEYYYGVFNPASSFPQFCQQGCVAGLSTLAQDASQEWARVSIGLGFSGDGSADTMIHEIGHAHGREHSPCGTNDVGYYPHAGADIGVQGYDIVEGSLKNRGSFTDFMGYCDPTWVSDYTYNWLFDRITAVNANAEIIPPPGFQSDWSSVRIDLDGTASRGTNHVLRTNPDGQKRSVEFLNASGELLETVPGRLHGYSHLDGGRLLFPQPGDKVAAVRLTSGQVVPW